MDRLKLSNLTLVKEENQILGNFTSVVGEYYIPQIGKTGFYKMNGCMIGAKEDEDLREMLSARVMDKIGFPHADILLASDNENGNGCLSINILNENEEFIEPDKNLVKYRQINRIDDFIENDLEEISTISGITSEDLRLRKEYLLKYLLVSALIGNTDIKIDNMFIIKNSETGEFRNPEYYDMAAAFIDSDCRNFFLKFSAEQIIEQLYELYPSQIVPFGRNIQEKLNKETIKEVLNDFFDGFSKESGEQIMNQLFKRVELIERLNSKEKNNFLYGTNSLHDSSKGTDISLIDKVKHILTRYREQTKGRDIDE